MPLVSSLRPRFVLVAVLLTSVLTAIVALMLAHERLRTEYEWHHWDRAIEISSVHNGSSLPPGPKSAGAFSELMKNPFRWGLTLSAPALEELRASPNIESVHRLLFFPALVDEANRPVEIHVVDPEFVSAFRLGNAKALGVGLSIATDGSKLSDELTNRYARSEFVLKKAASPFKPPLPGAIAEILPPARQTLGAGRFAPRPTTSPEVIQFYASPEWLDAPNRRSGFSINGVRVFVKIRPEVDVAAAVDEIEAIVARNPNPEQWSAMVTRVQPVMDTIRISQTRRALLRAGQWIPVALAVTMALSVLAFIWLRFRALSLELALRRGFGQGRWQAGLEALRAEFGVLTLATLAAGLIAWGWFAVQGHPWAAPKLWPAAVFGAAAGAGLSLLLARALVQRPTALLIKSHAA